MDSAQLLQELGHRIGLELEFEENGETSIEFDKDIVDFKPSPEGLWLIAEIDSSYGRQDLYRVLLAANKPGGDACGATISLDEDFDVFLMHRILPADMAYEAFEAALVLFIRTLRSLKKRCADKDGASASGEAKPFTVMDLLNAIPV